jgi:hypothetical protein
MPYKIVQHGNKFSVVAQNTGHVAGTHPSKSKAQAQMSALYANEPEATKKCMTCGCDDLGNDHHYISDTEKCSSCIEKERGTIAGDSSVNSGRISGGVGWKIEFNTSDCQHGWSVIKIGSGQSIGCYFKEEDAKAALEALAVTEPIVKDEASGQTKQDEQDGIGSLSFWNGSFAPVIGMQAKDGWMSTYNTPPQNDGKPSVGYGNHSDSKGRSNQ